MTFRSTTFSAPSTSVADAIAGADLAWEARRTSLRAGPEGVLVTTHVAITRSDTGHQLGIVGANYEPVQQHDGFAFIQPLVDSGEARIVSAGYVRGGSRVFIQAALRDGSVDVAPGDTVQRYVVFANSHDGSVSVSAGYTTIRIVCQNTLAAAARSVGFKARHTSGVHAALALFKEEFAAQRAALADQADTFRMLMGKKLSDRNLVRYVRETLAAGAGNDDTIRVRNVDDIIRLANEGAGATPGTLWGGFNAVTNWATHERGRSDDARANANMFGAGGALFARALDVAVAYADKLPSADAGRMAADNHATASADFGALLGKPSAVL